MPQLDYPVIIGTVFTQMHKCVLDFDAATVKCKKSIQGIQFCNNSVEHCVFLCIPAILQPYSRTVLPVKCDLNDANGDVLLEPVYIENSGAKCIAKLINGQCVYEILNPLKSPITLQAGLKLASCSKFTHTACNLCSVYARSSNQDIARMNGTTIDANNAVCEGDSGAGVNVNTVNLVGHCTINSLNNVKFEATDNLSECMNVLYNEVAQSSDEARYLQAADELNIDLTNTSL